MICDSSYLKLELQSRRQGEMTKVLNDFILYNQK